MAGIMSPKPVRTADGVCRMGMVPVSDDEEDDEEGCLSVPGLFFPTPRYEFARVRGVDAKNQPIEIEGTEVFAQMLQHEVGHLDGFVYTDVLTGRYKREAKRAITMSAFGSIQIVWPWTPRAAKLPWSSWVIHHRPR